MRYGRHLMGVSTGMQIEWWWLMVSMVSMHVAT